jgi:hypothetical protein
VRIWSGGINVRKRINENKRIYYIVEKRTQKQAAQKESTTRETSKESEGTERGLGFFKCLSEASCLSRQASKKKREDASEVGESETNE